MFASAQLRVMALAVSVTYAATTAPALAQARPDEETGLPTTPPRLESSNPNYEATPPTQPSGSAGLALITGLFGPLGFALGGLSVVVVTSDSIGSPATTVHPVAPAVVPHPSGLSE